jgi:SNF2 family DNA or RNA helicase
MITLRDYQEEAASKLAVLLKTKNCAYLAGEVRTGKTAISLATAKKLGYKRILFVTKLKAISSIRKDALSLGVYVLVTNYEQLKKYRYSDWDLLIADEAHGLGAYPKPSLRMRNLCTINYRNILLLSGTPSPESYSQLFHQFKLTRRLWHRYASFYEWAKAGYVDVQQKRVGTGQVVNDYSNANKEVILKDIEPYTVRVTQKQAGFQTQIEESVKYVQMKPITYEIAKDIIDDGISTAPALQGQKSYIRTILADTGAKKLSKLRQIYSGSCITEEGSKLIFDKSKAEYIERNYKGSKIAIMYTFDAEGRMLRDTFGDRATDSPEEFNSNEDAVFIGQVRASREGVNLSTAEYLLFYGIDYASLSYLQARERLSHLGRTTPPRVHYIFALNGIEPRVLQRVRAKKDFTVSHFRSIRGELSKDAHQSL